MARQITIFFFFLFSFLGLQAQESDLVGIVSYMKRTMNFAQVMPQEKVYLHFDNTGYFKGETIWFKGYVVRADTGKPTDLSGVLYVELVNPSGDVVETRKLPIQEGTAYGDIKLDSIYTTGFYEVRAYTRYMTNWGSGGIFSRVFPVFKAPESDGDYSKMVMDDLGYRKRLPNVRMDDALNDKENGLQVRFFPEGGKLVKGLTNCVAFQVSDKTGAHLMTGGALLDEKKQVVAAVNTIREGRGFFEVKPEGRPMYLRLADRKGKQHDFPLPEAKEEGLTLRMNTLKDEEVEVTVCATPSMVGKLLGFTLIHDGKVLQADTVFAESAMMIPFERASLPAGVSQLTFFTSDGHIQAERQFFICPKSQEADTIRIASPQAFPKPCKKVTVNIKAQPNSLLSFSAMDAATMTNGREGNALTWLLLSSDIKGYVEDPDYYFERDDRDHRLAADLLMMVQGWRRYDWALMANAIPQNEGYTLFDDSTAHFVQPIEDKLYVFGQLGQKRKKNTVEGVDLFMYFYNRQGQHVEGHTITDSIGGYAFALPNMDGEWKLIINTQKDEKNTNYYVGIDRHFSPRRRWFSPDETKTIDLLRANLFSDDASKKAAEDEHEYIPLQKREHVLPTVVVKARRRIFEGAKAAWESETQGQYFASMYYNADVDADIFADRGMEVPTLNAWLHLRNPFFGSGEKDEYMSEDSQVVDDVIAAIAEDRTATLGDMDHDMVDEDNIAQMDVITSTGGEGLDGVNLNEGIFTSTDKTPRINTYGLGYKNRPIVWILDNTYGAITNLGVHSKFETFQVFRPCIMDMPIFIDEVKSVYVSEDPYAFKSYLFCPDLMGMNPVTVFVYTHDFLPLKKKGLRVTHFQGYNKPSTFEMDDYSTFPPMEDFRRTLFWEPNVKTDAQGNATVEFWNNSSCHEMYISCEGMTKEGKFMINE